MPYVSPRGTVKSTIPTRQISPPQEPITTPKPEAQLYVELRQDNPWDRDRFIVEKLERWRGWSAQHEIIKDENELVGPLDEEANSEVVDKLLTVERPPRGKKRTLRIVTQPSKVKRVVRVSEIEVDERFISDDLM